MKRTLLFFYYLWALLTPVCGTNILSVSLAWHLAGIAAEYQEWKKGIEAGGVEPEARD